MSNFEHPGFRRLPLLGCLFLLLLSTGCADTFERASGRGVEPAASLPATTPWDLAALSKVPNYEWGEAGEVSSLYYEGETYRGEATRVFAYYASPATLTDKSAELKHYPGIVLVHGGGGKAFPQWVKLWASRGYAAIAMDLSGRGPGRAKLTDGGPQQTDKVIFHSMDEPITDQWTYHAVANVIRAHSLLASFPEVDRNRTAITGISWGGYLTCIAAGLDDRFEAAVPVYGCGFLHQNSVWLKDFNKMEPKNRKRWIRLWDPSRYVGSASVPMLFVNGGMDFAYPPDSHAKTYELVNAPKNLHFVPKLKHGHFFGRPKAIEIFIRNHLEGGVPLPKIEEPKVEGRQVAASVTRETKLTKAELHYTPDPINGRASERHWFSQPASIEGGKIRAELPPDEATIWFLTVEDERDALVSSPLVFPKQ